MSTLYSLFIKNSLFICWICYFAFLLDNEGCAEHYMGLPLVILDYKFLIKIVLCLFELKTIYYVYFFYFKNSLSTMHCISLFTYYQYTLSIGIIGIIGLYDIDWIDELVASPTYDSLKSPLAHFLQIII